MNPRGGCLAKLPGLDLEGVLAGAREAVGGNGPVIGFPEDCACVDLGSQPLLATTDLGPLIGRDLRRAGRIAALHALSDVYACGGVARWALSILIANHEQPLAFVEEVQIGVLEACAGESVRVIGGHTVTGPEAMAGLTVLGVPRGRVLRKSGAVPGDRLLLSKPLGVGLVARAYKLGRLGEEEFEAALGVMETSNGPAGALAHEVGVHAATDVTGFGLLGHLAEMLDGPLGAELEWGAIPVLASVRELLRGGDYRTYWSEGNLDYARSRHRLSGVLDPATALPLVDPQTNGGLLVAADPVAATRLEASGFTRVGTVTGTPGIAIVTGS